MAHLGDNNRNLLLLLETASHETQNSISLEKNSRKVVLKNILKYLSFKISEMKKINHLPIKSAVV